MKRTDPKRDSSVLYIGKGIIIISVLTISSLSFTLGYFVGKSIQPHVVNQTSAFTQQESAEQKNIDTEKKEAVVQEPIQETQQTAKIQQPQQNQQIKKAEETKETPKTRKYTVQAGVFKDASVADSLKAKLDKKGYRTYIIPSETKRNEKLYKVMVGEFTTRKEAEVLSIKIKNAESLKTFVTFKTEKEELR
jgi:cell division septation protein DedD